MSEALTPRDVTGALQHVTQTLRNAARRHAAAGVGVTATEGAAKLARAAHDAGQAAAPQPPCDDMGDHFATPREVGGPTAPQLGSPGDAGPTASQLHALAHRPQLAQVLLPAPQAAAMAQQQAAPMLERMALYSARLRACLSDEAEASNVVKTAAKPREPLTRRAAAPRALLASANHKLFWPPPVFGRRELVTIGRVLRLRPRAARMLHLLNEAARGRISPERRGQSASVDEVVRQADANLKSDTKLQAKALSFALRRTPSKATSPLAAPVGNALKAGANLVDGPVRPDRRPALAYPEEVSWSAFAAITSRDQLAQLLTFKLGRMREVRHAGANEAAAMRLEAAHAQRRTEIDRSAAVTQFGAAAASTAAAYTEGQASVLYNAEKADLRQERGFRRRDAAPLAALRAEQRAVEESYAARQRATRQQGMPHVGEVLDWLPARGSAPARNFRRIALTPNECAAMNEDERRAHVRCTKALAQSEASDVGVVYVRLSSSATQLSQAGAYTLAAATTASEAGNHDLARRYVQLGMAYNAASRSQRMAAHDCGYLQEIATANRMVKPDLAAAMAAESQAREGVERDFTAALARRADPNLAPAERAAIGRKLAALAQERADYDCRLASTACAVAVADQLAYPDTVHHRKTHAPALTAMAAKVAQARGQAQSASQQLAATNLLRDFSSTFPNEVVRVCLLSAIFDAAAKDHGEAIDVLAQKEATAPARDAAMQRLGAALAAHPDYATLCDQAVKQRLLQHVAARRLDVQDNLAAGRMLAAQENFWRHSDNLRGRPAGRNAGSARLFGALAPLAPLPQEAARHGASALDDKAFDPLHRLSTPQDVDFLDDGGVDKHFAQQATAGHVWSKSYHDTNFARFHKVSGVLQRGGSLLQQAAGGVRGLGEGSGEEVAAMAAQARDNALASLDQVHQATSGLQQQLLALHRAVG